MEREPSQAPGPRRVCSAPLEVGEITFTASGGTGQFTVVTTPGDCQWNLVNGVAALGVPVTSGFSALGNGLVRYSVQAHRARSMPTAVSRLPAARA